MVFVAAAALVVLAVVGTAGAGYRRSIRSRWVHELDAVRGEALVRPESSALPGAPADDRLAVLVAPVSPADRIRVAAEPPDRPLRSTAIPPASSPAAAAPPGAGATGVVAPELHGSSEVTCGAAAVRIGGGATLVGRDGGDVPAIELAGPIGWAWVRPLPTAGAVAGGSRWRGAGASGRRSATTAVVVGRVEVRAPVATTALIALAPDAVVVTVVEGSATITTPAARLTLGRGGAARLGPAGASRITVASGAIVGADPVVAANRRRDLRALAGRPAAVPPASPRPGSSRRPVAAGSRAR